jgi:hypothetical protein
MKCNLFAVNKIEEITLIRQMGMGAILKIELRTFQGTQTKQHLKPIDINVLIDSYTCTQTKLL